MKSMNFRSLSGHPDRTTKRLIRTAFGLTLAGAASLLVSGCQPPFSGAPPCMPPEYVLDSTSLKAGESLTVSAPDATCDPRYGERAQIQIDLLDEQNEALLTELAPMGDAGSFEHTLRIPATTKPGSYSISATPYGVDWCDDTGRNNRIENLGFGQSGMAVIRVACATPYVPFRVTK
ncbi:hypothetical protein [Paeniglutamicibacter sp. NPDC091659]|uniref:hypothetical protein n=1 Tax=Paeniglutamicibacter sp. NPDC091659 TaxID=3364389 RepID=UPI0038159271